MEAATTTFARRSMPPDRASPNRPTFVRWMWVWIAIGALVALVVVGFLAGIVSALDGINSGLGEANAAVTGIRQDANPLPTYIQRINANLTNVNTALKPIPGQADEISGALESIQGSLGEVNTSLSRTSGTLVDTSNSLVSTSGKLGTISSLLSGTAGTLTGISGSLADTSNKLVTISGSLRQVAGKLVQVRSEAAAINTTLNNAEMVRTNGTQAIWRHVRFANGGSFTRPGFDSSLGGSNTNPNGLQPVRSDADTIVSTLQQVVTHLASICNSNTLNTPIPGLIRPGPRC